VTLRSPAKNGPNPDPKATLQFWEDLWASSFEFNDKMSWLLQQHKVNRAIPQHLFLS